MRQETGGQATEIKARLLEKRGWITERLPLKYIDRPYDPMARPRHNEIRVNFPPDDAISYDGPISNFAQLSRGADIADPDLSISLYFQHQAAGQIAEQLNSLARSRDYADLQLADMAAEFVAQNVEESQECPELELPLAVLSKRKGSSLSRATLLAFILLHLAFDEEKGIQVYSTRDEHFVVCGDATGLPGYYPVVEGRSRYFIGLTRDPGTKCLELGEIPDRLSLLLFSERYTLT